MTELEIQRALSLLVTLPCDLAAGRDACCRALELLQGVGLSDEELRSWQSVLTEALNNALTHVQADGRAYPIRLDVTATDEFVEARVNDHTPGFELPERIELPAQDSEHGRGLFIMKSFTDAIAYQRGRDGNCLVLRRARRRPGPLPGAN